MASAGGNAEVRSIADHTLPRIDEESPSPPRHRSLAGNRAALVAFGAVEAIALPLMLWWDRGTWFQLDDWDFLATRTGGNVGDLLRPHFEHWTTLPILAYRLMWLLFGLRSVVPYEALVIVAHLTVAALLRMVMRRAGVGPWLSTLAATLFVFLGSGAENILVAFQIAFVGALAFGLVHLLLADHDGPVGRRDALGLLAGFAGLMCSGVAVTMVIVVGFAMLMRRSWRVALLHTAPLGAIYLVWRSFSPKETSPAYYHANSPSEVVRFVAVGMRATFRGLGQLPGVGIGLGLLLVVGLAVAFLSEDRRALRRRAAAPLALLAGAITFLVITGFYRSGQSNGLALLYKGFGPEHARTPRYIHIVAAMVLPALALAAQALIRHWRQATIAVVALLLVGLPGNIDKLAHYADTNRSAFVQSRRPYVLTAPRLPIARQLPRTLTLGPDLTLGWLIDSLPSGRIPKPGPRPPAAIARETLDLALQPSKTPQTTRCHPLLGPTSRVLEKGETITLRSGNASIVYLPDAGVPSTPKAFAPSTLIALAGPLQLRITPTSTTGNSSATVCG
ncbi:MAG: hypothetical protein QOH28_1216 [Actinomycetota bacterium]|nr:hypothetical protein [Actinomycetota bacterium]